MARLAFDGYLKVERDDNGVCANATCAWRTANSTTPQFAYKDEALSQPHPDPVLADATGVFPDMWLKDDVAYKAIIAGTGVTTKTIEKVYASLTINQLSNDARYIGAPGGATYVSAGSATAYTIATGFSLSALPDKMTFAVYWHLTNTGGATTLKVDGFAAAPIKILGADPVGGEFAAGTEALLFYDGTNFNVLAAGLAATTYIKTLLKTASAAAARLTLGISDAYDSAARLVLNGDFAIDQPNAGAEVTYAGSAIYGPDGVVLTGSGAGRYKIKSQISSTLYDKDKCLATNSILVTVTTANAAPGATDFSALSFRIEGKRAARLRYGSAAAATSVVRFRAQSSIACTIGGSLRNSAANRSYPWSVALAANTPTDVAITVPGDVTGTWLADTGIGINLTICLGAGSSAGGPANAWAGANYQGVVANGLMATLAATLEITGLDIVPGSAIPAIYIPPDPELELARCMREYHKSYNASVVPGTASSAGQISVRTVADHYQYLPFPVPMRTAPAVTYYDPTSTSSGVWRDASASGTKAVSTISVGEKCAAANIPTSVAGNLMNGHYVADARL